VEHFYVKFGDPSCISFYRGVKQTGTHINGG